MQFKNTPDRYGAVTKFFHWTIALLILALICVGLYMTNAEKSAALFKYYALHKSTGVLVLLLALGRAGWHVYSKKPGFTPSVKKWEAMAATAVHYFLYFCMFALPLSGWFFSSVRRGAVDVYGLFKLPQPFDQADPAMKNYAELAETFHGYLAYALIAVICMHVAGALKHFVIDRDMTLQRMLPFSKKLDK
ncbi:MAG: cytochrome b [Micavibrio sp.]|nr:cytochrome b [Micavibrio sp.]